MPNIIIQQEPMPSHQMPWPIVIDNERNVVHGRPDAKFLSGFGEQGTYTLTVTGPEFIANPELAIGLVPTFVDAGGNMFAVDLKVISAKEYAGDEDAMRDLRTANRISQIALDAIAEDEEDQDEEDKED